MAAGPDVLRHLPKRELPKGGEVLVLEEVEERVFDLVSG